MTIADNKKLELLLSVCSLIALGQDAPEGHHRLQQQYHSHRKQLFKINPPIK